MKKITLATAKSFIRKNQENLYINVTSSFDGMVDCVMQEHGGFVKVQRNEQDAEMLPGRSGSFGISGAWFVGGSGNYFSSFENEEFAGIQVGNCCGSFILAIRKGN